MRQDDGSAGDADYGQIGGTYRSYRRPDPQIGAQIHAALGASRSVLNLGAGSGSYEPVDREVVAVEPSASMRAQRPAHLIEAIDAVAEALPFADQSFDASMSTFSVHQWKDLAAGLREMRRVTRGPIVLLSCDPAKVREFWLNDYAPGVLKAEAARYPPIDRFAEIWEGAVDIMPVPIPLECRDGFNEAYYGRPERFLDPGARLACSAWSFVSAEDETQSIQALRTDLDSGAWDRRHQPLRTLPFWDGSLRLIVSPGH